MVLYVYGPISQHFLFPYTRVLSFIYSTAKDAVNAWANAVLDIAAEQASNYGLNVFKWDGELLPHHVHYLMRIMMALWSKARESTASESTNPSEHLILKCK